VKQNEDSKNDIDIKSMRSFNQKVFKDDILNEKNIVINKRYIKNTKNLKTCLII